jgi:hypothetical protein
VRTGPRRLLAAIAFASFTAFLFAAGCGKQGEGERCDTQNNDDDCAEGLVCVSKSDLHGNADICCPPSGSTNPECIPSAGTTSTTGAGGSGGGTTTSAGGAGGTGGGAGGTGGGAGGTGGAGGSTTSTTGGGGAGGTGGATGAGGA